MKGRNKYQLISTQDFLGNTVYIGSKIVFSIGTVKKLRIGTIRELKDSSILVEDFSDHTKYKVKRKKFVLPSIPKELKGLLG